MSHSPRQRAPRRRVSPARSGSAATQTGSAAVPAVVAPKGPSESIDLSTNNTPSLEPRASQSVAFWSSPRSDQEPYRMRCRRRRGDRDRQRRNLHGERDHPGHRSRQPWQSSSGRRRTDLGKLPELGSARPDSRASRSVVVLAAPGSPCGIRRPWVNEPRLGKPTAVLKTKPEVPNR